MLDAMGSRSLLGIQRVVELLMEDVLIGDGFEGKGWGVAGVEGERGEVGRVGGQGFGVVRVEGVTVEKATAR